MQWEFPFPLGPDDGRYVLREHAGEEAHHVLVLSSRKAPRPAATGRRARRRGRDEAPADPPLAEVGITRATVVDADVVTEDEAGAWLKATSGEAGIRVAIDALEYLNTALRMHRAAAANPYVREVEIEDALVTRVGYGVGDFVADGHWESAKLLDPPKARGSRRERRQAALRPQERLAALLTGREALLACEELALRGRLDLEQGRTREAALQTHLALEAAVVELQAFRELRDLGDRLTELDGLRDELAAAANSALQGGLDDATAERVAHGLGRVEAALRARVNATTY